MATEFCRKKSFVTDWCWHCRQMRRERQTPKAPCEVEEPLGCINPYLWAPMNKVPSQTTCCSLENPITDCRGTLGNTPPGNLSPSARTRDRTSSSLSTSSAHFVSLSFILADFLFLLYPSLPFICLWFSSASFITLLFTLSSFCPCYLLPDCPSVVMHRFPPSHSGTAFSKSTIC